MTDPLLSVEDLRTRFHTDRGVVRAVDGVSFEVERGETVCLVGESGSGKTVVGESLTRLIPSPPGEVDAGRIRFDGRDLTSLSDAELRSIRGDRIAHVFQNPQDALDPVYTVGWQIREAIEIHRERPTGETRDRAVDLLDRVGIPDAADRVDDYPHEFSGGMKQRVVLAMALAAEPDLLVADEPTTALDVTIQMGILRLLREIQAELGTAILLITHDLGIVAEVADRVVVVYAGKVMERADVCELFDAPAHPYTRALLDCLPGRGDGAQAIGGTLPSATEPPDGCRFHERCPHAVDACRTGEQPPAVPAGDPDHTVSCVYYQPEYDETVVTGDGRGGVGTPTDGRGASGRAGGTDGTGRADPADATGGEGTAGAVDAADREREARDE